jgi:sec-independent protein translocase protein TatB
MGEILGIGIEELIFVGILIALLFGPESIPKMARAAGRALNRLFRSAWYREGQRIQQQIQDLPAALARLAELEEYQKSLGNEINDLKKSIDSGLQDVSRRASSDAAQPAQPTSPKNDVPPLDAESGHSIAPPDAPTGPTSDTPSDVTH